MEFLAGLLIVAFLVLLVAAIVKVFSGPAKRGAFSSSDGYNPMYYDGGPASVWESDSCDSGEDYGCDCGD